jgi:hypothetical protein
MVVVGGFMDNQIEFCATCNIRQQHEIYCFTTIIQQCQALAPPQGPGGYSSRNRAVGPIAPIGIQQRLSTFYLLSKYNNP